MKTDEVYDENTKLEDLSDGELISIAEQMGMEDGIVRDCEGGLVNYEEIITAIKEVEGNKMKYLVWNKTDGLPASGELFNSKEEAREFIQEFRDRIRKHQGYWFTFDRRRIDPDDVVFEIMEEQ